MKAAVINDFGNPDVFEIKEIDKPVINPDQLLIKVLQQALILSIGNNEKEIIN